MEAIKPAAIFVVICLAFAFNLRLYSEKQGVLYSDTVMPDGWRVKCRYYTPFHFYEVEQPVHLGCPDYAAADR
ncbi:MAG: hypothetical protein N2444_07650 [Methylocystis sp.]|nr:hypothetical protein [Methylocystis sp.]